MASEYFEYLAKDEKPDQPPLPRSRKQKLQNWLQYNWYWPVIGVVLLSIVGSMLWNVLGIGKVRPDYVFAYIGTDPLPDGQTEAFEKELALLGNDGNGDGKVSVELRQYTVNRQGNTETALYYNYAAETLILADITAGDSYFFIVEDPESIQRAYQIFAEADGSAPDEDDFSVENKVFMWMNCPLLSGLNVDQDVFSGLYFGRRYFVDELAAKHEDDAAFWNLLTRGAVQ